MWVTRYILHSFCLFISEIFYFLQKKLMLPVVRLVIFSIQNFLLHGISVITYVWKYVNVEVYKHAGMQVCKYARIHVWKYASKKVYKYACMQVCFATVQVGKYTKKMYMCLKFSRDQSFSWQYKSISDQTMIWPNFDLSKRRTEWKIWVWPWFSWLGFFYING